MKYKSMHKNWSFPLKISSVNVTKFTVSCGFVTFTEEILNEKLHFLCSFVKVLHFNLLRDNLSMVEQQRNKICAAFLFRFTGETFLVGWLYGQSAASKFSPPLSL